MSLWRTEPAEQQHQASSQIMYITLHQMDEEHNHMRRNSSPGTGIFHKVRALLEMMLGDIIMPSEQMHSWQICCPLGALERIQACAAAAAIDLRACRTCERTTPRDVTAEVYVILASTLAALDTSIRDRPSYGDELPPDERQTSPAAATFTAGLFHGRGAGAGGCQGMGEGGSLDSP